MLLATIQCCMTDTLTRDYLDLACPTFPVLRPQQIMAVLGLDGFMLLARTPLLAALTLDGDTAYLELWRALSGSAASDLGAHTLAVSSDASATLSKPGAARGGGAVMRPEARPVPSGPITGAAASAGGSSMIEDAGMQAIALRSLGHGLFKRWR